MSTIEKKNTIKGGGFLIHETEAASVFIPEEWSEEQRMIAKTCDEFIEKEVNPHLDQIDDIQNNPDLMPSILDKAGQLGLLGISVPETYGGLGLDFNTSMLTTEHIGPGGSVAVALSAHTGIGTLPILYYGNEEQKKKYIPKLATGEWKAAYCLTEPDSGSDANSGKTKAKLSEDGKHYVLNGQKMWITNGGFADVYTVFAKIEDDKNLTAFIVEKTAQGISMNDEEKKMGIKGSSTRQLFFNDCKIPVENLLGDREGGFKIAVNILNIGRIKLGIAAIGGSKKALSKAIGYAKERKQFGTAIANFGAIKHKIAEMTVRIFASECAHYRAGQDLDRVYDNMVSDGVPPAEARLKSTKELAIECAILKIHGSEVLDFSVDEGVQIYGGMGYSAEAPMDRLYRDARINRIFEGTNEINRMLIIDMLLKRALTNQLDLMTPAKAIQKELTSVPSLEKSDDTTPFAKEKAVLRQMKKTILMVAGSAVQKYMQKLSEEQEILMNLADMVIETYVAESALLCTEKRLAMKGEKDMMLQIQKEMTIIYLHHALEKITSEGKKAICSFAEGDEQKLMLLGLKRFTKIAPYNLKAARRKVADYMVDKNNYPFA